MKLAVVFDGESEEICKDFEQAKVIKLYETEDREIVHTEMVGTMAESVEDILGLILMLDADCVLCDEIGREAMELLSDEGILFYSGLHGEADEAVEDFINGYIFFGPDD